MDFVLNVRCPNLFWPHWRIYYEFAEFFFASVIMCNNQTEYEILWAEIHYETTFWIHFWALFFCFIDFCLKLRVSMIIVQNYQFIPHTFFIRKKYFFHTKKNYTKKYFSIQKPVSVNLATWNALKTKYKNVKNNSFCFLNTYGFTVKISELIWNGWLWKKNSVN